MEKIDEQILTRLLSDPDLIGLIQSHSQLLEAVQYMANALELDLSKIAIDNHIGLNKEFKKIFISKVSFLPQDPDLDDDGIPI